MITKLTHYAHYALNRLRKRYYANKKGFTNGTRFIQFPTSTEGNEIIQKKLEEARPLMIARHGSLELGYTTMNYGFEFLVNTAGFFPEDRTLGKRFKDLYLNASKELDVLCCWNYRHGYFQQEQKLFSLAPDAELADLTSLSPFLFESPWTQALKGRKVLVVHPFTETITTQYTKRKKLFENPLVLPEFESLQTVKAVLSLAYEKVPYKSWFDALDYMKEEISKVDFEVALIACGAYGLPLAAHVKSLGKQAVHVGGALQLLFGIKGKRWESPEYNYNNLFYNSHWVSPSSEETPKQYKKADHGSYWS